MKTIKNAIKTLLNTLNEWFTWLTSDTVMEAINNEGMTYEEVVAVAKEEMQR